MPDADTTGYRCLLRVSAHISPALPHLTDPEQGATVVETSMIIVAPHADDIPTMLDRVTSVLTYEMGERLGPHPRSAPSPASP